MSAKYFRSFWRLTQVKKMQGIWQKYKPTSEFGNIIRMLFPSELVGCLKRVCLLGFWVEVWGLKRSLRKFLHLLRPLIGWYEKRFRRKDTHPVLHKNCQGAICRPKIRPMRKLAPQHHIHFFFKINYSVSLPRSSHELRCLISRQIILLTIATKSVLREV